MVAGSCGDSSTPPLPEREARFGVLRDLELFPRSARQGGPFFLDRFEVTRSDWARYASETGMTAANLDGSPGELPVVGLDLQDARGYAAWRFGRLPRYDEWAHAASGGGSYRRPWGDSDQVAWANSRELGFGALTPVGAFEAGRQPGGPYDLFGNAAEWTETPDPRYLAASPGAPDERGSIRGSEIALRAARLRASGAADAVLTVPGAPWPLAWITWVDSARLPRLVAPGWNRPLPASGPIERDAAGQDTRLPRERSSVLGLRVASDPRTLLRLLAQVADDPLSESDEAALRRFLGRPAVWTLLADAARQEPSLVAGSGAAARLLRTELDL
ncbi:MAG: SUMF1/EgtB/PvdO family nonheme iron enzyme [Planctomycetota bacterium]|nr:SUMF1/EgtB/PvdO family nonheme iron enzyme [Planctomycetota bacterium]